MKYYFNSQKNERITEENLFINYGLTDNDSQNFGWNTLNIDRPLYNELFYCLTDNGTIRDIDNNAYKVKWVLQERDINNIKNDLKKSVAARRYEEEISGVEFNGQIVSTERDKRNTLLTNIKLLSDLNTDINIKVKTTSGWLTLSRNEILDLVSKITLHVQNCMDIEAEYNILIDRCNTFEELIKINLNEKWPIKNVTVTTYMNLLDPLYR